MKTLINNVTTLDELVFENRNKSYGAYNLRESYDKSLMRGLLIGTAIIFTFFGSVYGIHYMNMEVEVPQEPVLTMREIDNTPIKEEKKPAEAVKPKEAVQPKSPLPEVPKTPTVAAASIPIVADSSRNIGKPIELAGNGPAGATGGSVNGTGGQTGDTTGLPPIDPTIPVDFADEPPVNENLSGYLAKNLVYPRMAQEQGIQGVVIVSFVVDTTGAVSKLGLEKGTNPALDKEALRVAKGMPKWKPAIMNGHKVSFLFRLPIRFRLK